MNEKQKDEVESGEDVDINGVDYIKAINDLKANSVSKSDYEKLQEENKKLLQSLVNGESYQQPVEDVDIEALRKELFSDSTDLSNLEYMTKVMQLRDAIIEGGGTDPFLPYGKKIMPTDEDIATANRVSGIIRECIDYADGDSAVFTAELQRRMIDTAPGRRK